MDNIPAKYNQAKKAIAACVRVVEAKAWRDKAEGLRAYAAQAKDAELMALSVELRKRAERRIGELIAERRAAGKLATGGDAARARVRGGPEVATFLADDGIDKHLADRSRKAADMPKDKFEAYLAKIIALAVAHLDGEKDLVSAVRAELHEARLKQRAKREKDLATKLTALPEKKYGVILADPEWKFKTYSPKGLSLTSPDNHYVTSELEDIKARDVASIAADDLRAVSLGHKPDAATGARGAAVLGFQVCFELRLGEG